MGDDEEELTEEVAELFRIETNLFEYETPLCKEFKEFNYLLKIDEDVLTSELSGFKTYEEFKNTWYYEWNDQIPWVFDKLWDDSVLGSNSVMRKRKTMIMLRKRKRMSNGPIIAHNPLGHAQFFITLHIRHPQNVLPITPQKRREKMKLRDGKSRREMKLRNGKRFCTTVSTGRATIPPKIPKIDYTNSLPDECLTLIFNFLTTTHDRNNSSRVCHRWLQIDAQTRTHLTLNARERLQRFIPQIFIRFDSLTRLVLHNHDYNSYYSINDKDMILITSMCPNLTRLKIIECRRITDSGMAVFSKNCKKLKEFSYDHCWCSDSGIFELLDNSSQLEVLSVTRLFIYSDDSASFCAGLAAKTLKVIKLRHVHSERVFQPLIIGAKNLKRLKLVDCDGNWDRTLEMIPDDNCLVEVHLEGVNVSDVGLSSLAKCRDLLVLRIDNYRCTDVGLISVAENCRALKKLYVGRRSEIGDSGLIAVGRHSVNLQELILNGVEATCVSLEVIATNCQNLVRLELCQSDTITDVEVMFIAEKCVALKILCIEECGVSNNGIEAFALGCPNLAEIRVTKCKKLTREVKDWLIARRGSLVVEIECT
ncbi:VIER F-box protein 2 [Artemisia annua]|uniref:VIER F-box protein 2 n=1 Tax=Artemisia annua TaxID=35608 RepID=A0A2U1P807_ARTAN|nr:VIER F-box protein 2 [Artemisia annua]